MVQWHWSPTVQPTGDVDDMAQVPCVRLIGSQECCKGVTGNARWGTHTADAWPKEKDIAHAYSPHVALPCEDQLTP